MFVRSKYRGYLYSGVASAALIIASSGAFAQTAVNQSATNFGNVSNPVQNPPAASTNTITLGGASLGLGASASVSATGAVTSTSVSGIGSDFSNPIGGFGPVNQDPFNTGAILNNGAIFSNSAGTAATGSSLNVGAAGSVASFSILGMGATTFTAVPTVGDIRQGTPVAPNTGVNLGPVTNTGLIGAPGLTLSGTGASASISAVGSQGSVSVGALGATSFSQTAFGNISQNISNGLPPGPSSAAISNTSTGIVVGDLSGNGASVSTAATGAAASISFSYVDTTAWSVSNVNGIGQSVTNLGDVTNLALGAGTQVGDISGAGASVRAGATGSIAALVLSSVASGGTGTGLWGAGLTVFQNSSNSGAVTNAAIITGGGLTGVGSSAAINATGAGAAVSVASISDTSNPQVIVGSITQTVTHTGAGPAGVISNSGILTLNGALAAGASASVSAVGAQGSVSISAIDSTAFTTPGFQNVSQSVVNGPGGPGTGGNVSNTLFNVAQASAVSVGNVNGNGASVSVAATGAAASVSYSFVDTTGWLPAITGIVTQTANNSGIVNNLADAGISVGNIGGIGASVRASATGSLAAISLTSINSGPAPATPPLGTFTLGPVTQSSINNAPVINAASIVSSGTVSGIGSSVGINATGAGASFSVASIADTGGSIGTLVPTIQQTVTNASTALVNNTGSITLGTGTTMGAGSSAVISAVGASASVSFLAVK